MDSYVPDQAATWYMYSYQYFSGRLLLHTTRVPGSYM